ncbi:unnamed protein product [Lampetra fluviatilis]
MRGNSGVVGAALSRDLFEMIEKMQGNRIDDQRCPMPKPRSEDDYIPYPSVLEVRHSRASERSVGAAVRIRRA